MSDIIKSFQFVSENVTLVLSIKKGIYKNNVKIYINANVVSENKDLRVETDGNDIILSYKTQRIFWLSHNTWKGLRWENYKNETGFVLYSPDIADLQSVIKSNVANSPLLRSAFSLVCNS